MSKTNQNLATKNGKNVGYRILAAVLAALCVAVFFLPVKVIVGVYGLETKSLFEVLKSMSGAEYKLFGFLSAFTGSTALGTCASICLYGFLLCLVAALVLSILAICLGKKAPLLTGIAVFVFTWGVAMYALSVLIITSYLSTIAITFDAVTISLAVIGALTYFSLMILKLGKTAIINGAIFLLALVFSGCVFLGITHNGYLVAEMVNAKKAYKVLVVVLSLLMLTNLGVISARAMCKKCLYVDLVCALVEVVIAIGVCYLCYSAEMLNKSYVFLALLGAAIAVVQILVSVLYIDVTNRQKVQEAKEAFMSEFDVEEYAEAVPYTGGPVAGVQLAMAVPAEQAEGEATEENEAESPCELCEGAFDPFISSLTAKERNEFADLYILRSKGAMSEIPEYIVGGDNKNFFSKVFINLGKYREVISNELLAKIYEYSIKL